MRLLIVLLLLFLILKSSGQSKKYQSLLDSAFCRHGVLFAHSKPLITIRLNLKEMGEYFNSYRDYSKKALDTLMFSQIIQNSKSLDTTLWSDKELTNYLLVNSEDEMILKKYAVNKLSLTDKKKIRFYMKQVHHYNSTDIYDRNIYHFSRPVFDNSKTFAIIQWDNAHSGLDGGGGIILYHLQSSIWVELGSIMNWKY